MPTARTKVTTSSLLLKNEGCEMNLMSLFSEEQQLNAEKSPRSTDRRQDPYCELYCNVVHGDLQTFIIISSLPL